MRKVLGKIIIFAMLLATLFSIAFFGSYYVFNEKVNIVNQDYLTRFYDDESQYYLQKADPHIEFYINLQDIPYDNAFSLTDEDGNTMPKRTEKISDSQLKILPPDEGYEKGAYYTLELTEGAFFAGEALKNARALDFFIEKDFIERYTFTDMVSQVAEPINEIDENSIKLPSNGYKTGDILFGLNQNNEYAVYKIDQILNDNTASITIPAIDEIYSDIEVYGEYTWSVEEIAANPELEIEIEKNIRQSAFYENLIRTAYAGQPPKDAAIQVNIKPNIKNAELEIEIKFSLTPGDNGLFGIQKLKYQQVSITLNSLVDCSLRSNYKNIKNFDFSVMFSSAFSWSVDISFFTKEWEKENDLDKLFSENNKFANRIDYHENIRKLTDALNNFAADVTGGEIKLFDWKLPIPSVPGLYFSTEVKLFLNLEMAVELSVGQSATVNHVMGVSFKNGKFKPYSNTYMTDDSLTLALKGKAECKAGIKLEIKATLISSSLASVCLDPQVGLYADLYITWPIIEPKDISTENFVYSYFEAGIYAGANITAKLNYIIDKFDYSVELFEKKYPIKELGNDKIALGINSQIQSVRAIDNVVTVPFIAFDYYDVKKGMLASEILPAENLKIITSDNQTLEIIDNKVTLPSTDSGNVFLTATYRHADGKNYSAIFKVLISGSLLEGKVSAYMPDASPAALPGAMVKLYELHSTTPLTTTTTGEDGKFSFSVSKGTYTLVIEASGYKTLTTTQSIEENEIKYTEHILLIDDGQTGMGAASGHITNALDGRGLSGVEMRLRPNWNTTTGDYIEGFVTYSGESGEYSISDIPSGYYTIEASLDSFVTGYSNIIVMQDNPKNDFDFSITPVLSDDEIRIVLTWGPKPTDLDSHLIGRTPSGDAFNVYYRNKIYSFNGVEMANLDVDDTTSYGPETITILNGVYDSYIYAVHDYSNAGSSGSTALSYSDAVVRVYRGSRQLAEYNVPTDQIGTYWTVFEISQNRRITPVNTVSNTKPSR